MRIGFLDFVELIDPNGSEAIWITVFKGGSVKPEAKVNTASNYLDLFKDLEVIRITATAINEFSVRIGEKDD
jgi:hypothetical protein